MRKTHAVLIHDYCPWVYRWMYWIKHPLASLGAATIVAGCCGALVNRAGFVILGVRLGVEHRDPTVVIRELLESIAVLDGFTRGGR